MIDLSIIIVNYHSFDLLCSCIDSIIKNTKLINYEIIVVDNNSNENCKQRIEERFDFSIKCIELQSNIGFGKANNEGLKIADGRNIIFLNPDTILINDALTILSQHLDRNGKTGAVGGNLYDSEMQPTRSYRRRRPDIIWLLDTLLFFNQGERLLLKKNLFFNNSSKNIDIGYVVGADLMVKKEILDSIGGFNPIFFMYYEEIELCNRINKAGFKIQNIPYAKIQHLEGKSTSNISFRASEMYKSLRNYFYITENKYLFTISRFLYFCISLQRFLINKVLRNQSRLMYWKIQLNNFFKF